MKSTASRKSATGAVPASPDLDAVAQANGPVQNGRGGSLTSKGHKTRSRLLEVAQEVFGETGYDKASISEITRRAGVAQGTFYLYFAGKKEIFSELVREIGRRLRHEIQEAVANAETRRDVERLGFQTFFDFVRRNPSIYRIVRQAEFVDRDAFRDYYETFARGYMEGLKQAAANGEIRDLDPEVAAWCLMGIGDMMGVRWILLGEEGKLPKRALDQMLELIAAALKP